MEVRPEHSANNPAAMYDIFLGRVMDVKLLQREKADSFISVTLSGIVIEESFEQPLKELPPIVVTLDGMLMDVRPEHS